MTKVNLNSIISELFTNQWKAAIRELVDLHTLSIKEWGMGNPRLTNIAVYVHKVRNYKSF